MPCEGLACLRKACVGRTLSLPELEAVDGVFLGVWNAFFGVRTAAGPVGGVERSLLVFFPAEDAGFKPSAGVIDEAGTSGD